jgi:putative hydrolase of the HAD superfamily
MLRAVFFDAAGTLFEAREPIAATYARIAAEFGLNADAAAVSAGFARAFGSATSLAFGPGRQPGELRRLERKWWREVVRRTFEGLGHFADFDAYFDSLFAYFADPKSWIADPEAVATLQRLKREELGLGVISNFDHRLYHILEGLNLSACFDSVTISSEAGYAKPSPELFRFAMRKHSVASNEALHVGDSQSHDFAGARAAGMAVMLLDRACQGPPEVGDGWARAGSLAYLLEVAQRLRLA